jgi:DASH complex subunit DAD2
MSAPTHLSPSLQILWQKQQEYSGLQALKEASGDMVARVEKLAEMSHIMADGGEGTSRWGERGERGESADKDVM